VEGGRLRAIAQEFLFFRIFSDLVDFTVRGAKLVAVVAEVGLAGGRLVRQAGL
jgi:hypothetical protein